MSTNFHYDLKVVHNVKLHEDFVQTPSKVTDKIMNAGSFEDQLEVYLDWVKEECPYVYNTQKELCETLKTMHKDPLFKVTLEAW